MCFHLIDSSPLYGIQVRVMFSFVSEEVAMEVAFGNDQAAQLGVVDSHTSCSGTGIAAAAADLASATGNLAESIVDSVLRPAMSLSGISPATASSSVTSEGDAQQNLSQQHTSEDQEMEHGPVEVRAGVSEAPDFSELTTGLLSSLSEILPSVTATQMALSGISQETESESCPEASYESSYPNSASSLDSTQLGSMLAQSCNTVTPAPISSYSRDAGEDGDEARSPPQGTVSVHSGRAEADYDSDNSNLNSVSGPPPLIPLEEVVNMEITEAADEEEEDDDDEEEEEEDDEVPVAYPHQSASHTLLESIRRAGRAPRNLQEAVDMVSFESTDRLLNEMEDAEADISRLEMVRELEDIQSAVSNGVHNPVNGSESLDLEAAASWLRSHVEARVSQQQREGDIPEQSSCLPSQPQYDSGSHGIVPEFENRYIFPFECKCLCSVIRCRNFYVSKSVHIL